MSGLVHPRPSAAIRIVAPSGSSSAPSSPTPAHAVRDTGSKPQTPKKTPKCRNVLIHGYCKNQGKGCAYDHSDGASAASSSTAGTNMGSPVSAAATAVNVNAPVFVPKTTAPTVSSPDPFKPSYLRDASELESARETPSTPPNQYQDPLADYDYQPQSTGNGAYARLDMLQPAFDPGSSFLGQQGYYSHMPTFAHQPLNYHLYTPLPYAPPTGPSRSVPPQNRFFMSHTLREDLQRRSEAIYTSTPSAAFMPARALPEELHSYHSLVPLEPTEKERRKLFLGCSSLVYKATNREDGTPVVLRRIEGFRLTQTSAFGPVEGWSTFKHPNIASLREAFTTRAFGDNSLVFVYDFYPSAITLYQAHIAPPDPSLHIFQSQHSTPRSRAHRNAHQKVGGGRGGSNDSVMGTGVGEANGPIEESVLWSYVMQIANAMKQVHERGLAFRTLEVSKVLVTGKHRIRVNCCGIFDVLTPIHDPRPPNIDALQQEDLLALGRLIITLCTRTIPNMNNLPKALESISRTYSTDVKNMILFLISKPAPGKTVDGLLEMFGTRLLAEMNVLQTYTDQLENELMGELENSRLVRLMSKLGFINERPDFAHELRWSETGDRYILSLFRDYVFHQVDEAGLPVVNLTHVITCLNKLDAGVEERIMLVSRDEQTCFVVSYREIKNCVESAFGELAPRR